MNYTFATVIIKLEDKQAAQTDLGTGFFTTELSTDSTGPATHLMSSGPFDNAELDLVVNSVTWAKKVYFGNDWQSALLSEGLVLKDNTPEVNT